MKLEWIEVVQSVPASVRYLISRIRPSISGYRAVCRHRFTPPLDLIYNNHSYNERYEVTNVTYKAVWLITGGKGVYIKSITGVLDWTVSKANITIFE